MNRRARTLLWIDCAAAATVGTATLALRDWIAALHQFPGGLVRFMGVVNLVYASYSGTLAARASRGLTPTRRAVDVLILGNAAWCVVCLSLAVVVWPWASAFGLAQLLLEGAFVATLAALERRLVRPFARAPA